LIEASTDSPLGARRRVRGRGRVRGRVRVRVRVRVWVSLQREEGAHQRYPHPNP
jgi:hypothetical protein